MKLEELVNEEFET